MTSRCHHSWHCCQMYCRPVRRHHRMNQTRFHHPARHPSHHRLTCCHCRTMAMSWAYRAVWKHHPCRTRSRHARRCQRYRCWTHHCQTYPCRRYHCRRYHCRTYCRWHGCRKMCGHCPGTRTPKQMIPHRMNLTNRYLQNRFVQPSWIHRHRTRWMQCRPPGHRSPPCRTRRRSALPSARTLKPDWKYRTRCRTHGCCRNPQSPGRSGHCCPRAPWMCLLPCRNCPTNAVTGHSHRFAAPRRRFVPPPL